MNSSTLIVCLLVAPAVACERAQVSAAPEPPASLAAPTASPVPAATVLPGAPQASASSPSPAGANPPRPLASAPGPDDSGAARNPEASKKRAPSPAGDVCEGAAREGCVPKNDPFGFVARD